MVDRHLKSGRSWMTSGCRATGRQAPSRKMEPVLPGMSGCVERDQMFASWDRIPGDVATVSRTCGIGHRFPIPAIWPLLSRIADFL